MIHQLTAFPRYSSFPGSAHGRHSSPLFLCVDQERSSQVQWEWKSFTSSARPDLELKHWQKKGVQWEDYPFAKFNKRLKLLAYSDAEYESLLESPEWSRQKTDELMAMVQQFDMNFLVIQVACRDTVPASRCVTCMRSAD